MEEEKKKRKYKRFLEKPSAFSSLINNLDDGCLMHIFSFLSPIPDRYNSALVCDRWRFLACHPRHWLRVDRSVKDSSQTGVFPNVETAVAAARPGDTILIAAGGTHRVSNIQINKPLCLIGGGELPDDTTLKCSRGAASALEFLSTCKVTNLTVKAELGCCLLHRSGRLIIEGCILQCETNPLDYLSYAIVCTAGTPKLLPPVHKGLGDCSDDGPKILLPVHKGLGDCSADGPEILQHVPKGLGDGVSVSHTRIEGGAKAVSTCGTLALQHVRVIYARRSVFFWFNVERR